MTSYRDAESPSLLSSVFPFFLFWLGVFLDNFSFLTAKNVEAELLWWTKLLRKTTPGQKPKQHGEDSWDLLDFTMGAERTTGWAGAHRLTHTCWTE